MITGLPDFRAPPLPMAEALTGSSARRTIDNKNVASFRPVRFESIELSFVVGVCFAAGVRFAAGVWP